MYELKKMEEDISDGYELDEELDEDLESNAFSDSQSIESRSCGESVSEKDTQVYLEEEMVSNFGNMSGKNDKNDNVSKVINSGSGKVLSDGGNNANATFFFNQAEKWPNLASVVKDTILNGNSMNVDETVVMNDKVMKESVTEKRSFSFRNVVQGMNHYGNNKLKLIPGRINDKGRHVANMDPLLDEGSKA
ncbi:hypothetical protein Tco_1378846 [Tanacetum coccineum]